MITSLLDNDLYQFTMSAAMWNDGMRDTQVRYEFRNRTFSVPLGTRLSLDWLAVRIKEVQALRFTSEEIQYLTNLQLFPQGWLDWLPTMELPDVHLGAENGHLVMTYEGPVISAIFWETILLALVNEGYFSRFGDFLGEGSQRLIEKIEYLRERKTIRFVEFGTRRRFSKEWQHFVTHEMLMEIPHLISGTSNVLLAKELNITPVGTMAHQLFMILTALNTKIYPIDRAIEVGTNEVLDLWLKTYSDFPSMLTVLPDTYGTEKFIEVADLELVREFTRFRQDSGNPIQIGDLLRRYSTHLLQRQDPAKIVFSDSLDVRSMSVLDDHFSQKGPAEAPAEISFGWGTNLTNDLGYEPLSIVIKPCAVLHHDAKTWLPCVKISDDTRKATGDPKAVAEYLAALGF